MSVRQELLGLGDRALDFVLPCQDGTPTRFYGKFGGTPVVMFFYHSNCDDCSLRRLVQLSELLTKRPPGDVMIVAINSDPPSANRQISATHDLRFPVLSDIEGRVSQLYGVPQSGTTRTFILDSNLRILETHDFQENESVDQRVEAVLDSLPRIDPVEIIAHAPVLLIPNVLDQPFCELLIDTWHTQGNIETGVERSREGGREQDIDSGTKRRRDHTVTDSDLLKRITSAVGRRIIPEVQKAFSFRATRFEGFKIACYDASVRGHFHAHRDNLSPATAHRRFALTLNLNEGYEGGHLRFAEYAPHLYRPKAGGALVFSCSLLHEATEVTMGQRFVLLSFLFGEQDLRSRPPAPP